MQDAGLHTSYLQGIRPDVSGGPKHRQTPGGELAFDDFVDAVNPLHHLPGVSVLYREATGDTIKAPMKVIGGALLGGPLGFLGAVADVVLEELTGRDFGGHVVALFEGDESNPAAETLQVAKHEPSVTVDVQQAQAEPGTGGQAAAAAPEAAAPPPPASLRQLAGSAAAEVPSAPVQPVQLSALNAASSYEGSQIPRELMESLYRMHQDQYMQAMQGERADRRF